MSKKSWFITGASSGFGLILAKRLLARGDRVAATARNPAFESLASRFGEALWTAPLDVTDNAAVGETVHAAFEALGQIDVIVNNAGYGLSGAAEEVSDEQIRRQIDTNLVGSIQVVRAALPKLRTQGGGMIVQLSSEAGLVTYPNFSLYHASKWGIEGFTEALAKEVQPFGIRCMIVEPGAAATNFRANRECGDPLDAYENTPVGDMRRTIANGNAHVPGDPERMVDVLLEAIERDDPPFRVVLGGNAYRSIRASIAARLASVEASEAIAFAADTVGGQP